MQAKVLLASGLMAALLASCSDRAAELGAQWGCGPVDGLAQFKDKTPKFVLVGEFIETNEAPAAFAELACHLASRQQASEGPLFVGVSEYLGGATDAETAMRARLDALAAKGAPIVIGAIGGEDRPYSVRQRSAVEKEWAQAIETKIAATGSSRALLLMSRTDAIAAPIPRKGDRFAGYNPMATFLPDGDVLALEIRTTPQAGVSAPAIRLYPKMTDGFHGQIALGALTRPFVAMLMPGPFGRSQAEADGQIMTVERQPGAVAADLLDRVRSVFSTAPRSEDPSSTEVRLQPPEPLVDLPEFEVENPPP
jgi:hypothetical protein